MTLVLFLIILAALILVHEFGHFIVAKRSGIKVDEFGLGFPPRLFSWKHAETTYSLNLIPFGGFVKIFGETPDEASLYGPDRTRSFAHTSRHVQAAVLIAGVTMNLLFAWFLLSLGFIVGMPTAISEMDTSRVRDPKVLVTSVREDTPAAEAALLPGDTIVSVRSDQLWLVENAVTPEAVQNFIASHGDIEIEIKILRDKKIQTIHTTPREGIVVGRPALGFTMEYVGIQRLLPHEALWQGLKMTGELTHTTAVGLYEFITKALRGSAAFDDVTGPIGIAVMVGTAHDLGFTYLLSFTALISINLAILNLVPFPALDGGRLFVVGIEAIRREAIQPAIVNIFNAIGFALLILLMFVITYRDIMRYF